MWMNPVNKNLKIAPNRIHFCVSRKSLNTETAFKFIFWSVQMISGQIKVRETNMLLVVLIKGQMEEELMREGETRPGGKILACFGMKECGFLSS